MSDKITAEKKSALITRQLEIDLRKWVEFEILNLTKLKNCLKESVYKFCFEQCVQRKKALNERVIESQITDIDLIEFIDYSTSLSILYSNQKLLNKESQDILNRFKDDLDKINPIRNDAIHGRTLLANQYKILEDFCEKIKNIDKIFIGTSAEFNNLEEGSYDINIQDYAEIDERDKNNNLPIPEYQDTGFIERKEINAQIKKKIQNHNVISFIGDAGSGKTALALKKCYDYLYDKEETFDVFLYHSFKTETFSKGEVIDLQKDINTTDKFFKNVEIENLDDDPIMNLIKYLENNKVLLFLDNLENVLDSNIINFLELFAEADHNSKIFITSRIPISHGDIPIKVGSFTDKEATDYFQRLCRYLQLKNLQSSINESQIKKLVNKRKNNPLFIKLALNTVSENFTLDEAFKEDKDLLNYSYMNIYKTLNDNNIRILEVIYLLKKELNLSTICDLLQNISPEVITFSLRELTRKNFVSTSYKQSQIEYYFIRKEVIPFIEKNKYFSDVKNRDFILKKYSKFKSFEMSIPINIKDLPDKIDENWSSFLCRKDSDRGAIFRLRKIQNLIGRKVMAGGRVEDWVLLNMLNENEKEVTTMFTELKVTHADYCEVFRMEGVYNTLAKKTAETILAFEKAISLQPDYINLYNYYSDSLSRLQEPEKFLENTKTTLEKFPNNSSAKMFRLVSKMWNNQFDEECDNLYKQVNLMLKETSPSQFRRKVGMRLLRYHIGKSEFEIKKGNYEEGFVSLNNAFVKFFKLEASKLVDNFTINTLKRCKRWCIEPLMNHFRGDSKVKELMKFNMNINDAIRRVADEVTFRQKRAYPDTEVNGIVINYKLKTKNNISPGFMIEFNDRYILDKGEERKEIFIPNRLAKKSNLNPGDKIKFILKEVRNTKGHMIFIAEQIEKLD